MTNNQQFRARDKSNRGHRSQHPDGRQLAGGKGNATVFSCQEGNPSCERHDQRLRAGNDVNVLHRSSTASPAVLIGVVRRDPAVVVDAAGNTRVTANDQFNLRPTTSISAHDRPRARHRALRLNSKARAYIDFSFHDDQYRGADRPSGVFGVFPSTATTHATSGAMRWDHQFGEFVADGSSSAATWKAAGAMTTFA